MESYNEAERIETKILDKASQVDRTLLPLYIVHEYLAKPLMASRLATSTKSQPS
ncbi:MAG: hypothetical protein U5K43_13035 [Halofilum sp. (in: g-proteobacteria)]|nr:hypothetical protein [Halofilum sp. (in: g-proteobacteria)]